MSPAVRRNPDARLTRTPLVCGDCRQHQTLRWWLPMPLPRAIALMKGLCCQRCGGKKLYLRTVRKKH